MVEDLSNSIDNLRAISKANRSLCKEVYGFSGNECFVFMNGGLGNQLLQFFLYGWLTCTLKVPVIVDDTDFFITKAHNGLEIDKIFNLKIKRLSQTVPRRLFTEILNRMEGGEKFPEQLYQAGYPITAIGEAMTLDWSCPVVYLPSYYQSNLRHTGMLYYRMYSIVPYYLQDLQKYKLFPENPFPPLKNKGKMNEKYANEIISTESVALHIRRGDFVNLGWEVPFETYAETIADMNHRVSNPVYFIFSDDLKYCQEHISELGLTHNEVVFVEGNKKPNNYIDMQLMSMCKHRIVNNSTFCYCAALFRRDKDGVVINLRPDREIL